MQLLLIENGANSSFSIGVRSLFDLDGLFRVTFGFWNGSKERVRNESVNDFSISMFVVVLLNYVFFSHLLFKHT